MDFSLVEISVLTISLSINPSVNDVSLHYPIEIRAVVCVVTATEHARPYRSERFRNLRFNNNICLCQRCARLWKVLLSDESITRRSFSYKPPRRGHGTREFEANEFTDFQISLIFVVSLERYRFHSVFEKGQEQLDLFN